MSRAVGGNVRRVVIAIDGNAIVKEHEEGTVTQQFANTRATVRGIVEIIKRGHRVTLSHGNGPQVGNILIRVHAALGRAYPIPVGVAVAESQGEIGYMIGQSLHNRLLHEGLDLPVAVILTQVLCDRNDPALSNPTKPVGPFYDEHEAARLSESGFQLQKDSGRGGFRVVVPSPRPLHIIERESIRILVREGVVVIAAGGGGMPVYETEDGALEGIDGVVDKDYASALLARELGADDLVFLTGSEHVYVDWRGPNHRAIRRATVSEMQRLASEGHFPAGSMGPKVGAAIEFIQAGGSRSLITSAESLATAFSDGLTGTWVVGDDAMEGAK